MQTVSYVSVCFVAKSHHKNWGKLKSLYRPDSVNAAALRDIHNDVYVVVQHTPPWYMHELVGEPHMPATPKR